MERKANDIEAFDQNDEVGDNALFRIDKLDVAGRLRQVVEEAGGRKAVSTKSGVPLGTLDSYTGGRSALKLAPFVALAAACKVSLDWLATGIGPKLPHWHVPEPASDGRELVTGPVQPLQAPAQRDAFATIDIGILTEAIALLDAAFAARGVAPEPRRRAQLILLTYDELKEQSAEHPRVSAQD